LSARTRKMNTFPAQRQEELKRGGYEEKDPAPRLRQFPFCPKNDGFPTKGGKQIRGEKRKKIFDTAKPGVTTVTLRAKPTTLLNMVSPKRKGRSTKRGECPRKG